MKRAILNASLLFWSISNCWASDLEIKCQEMIEGTPSQAVTYRFIEKTGELVSSTFLNGPLSTFKETKLGHTSSSKGGNTSYSIHKWIKKGELLKRTVRHVPDDGSKEKERSIQTIFDFKHQKVLDGEKIDSCRHTKI